MKNKFCRSATILFMAVAAVFAVVGGASSTAWAQAAGGRAFSGGIGETRIEMNIRREGESLTGSYYYSKSADRNLLMLKGTIAADGSFTMQASDAAGKNTGEFKGKWNQEENEPGASLDGQWVKPGQTDEVQQFWAFEQMIYFTASQITTREYEESIKLKNAKLSAEYPELSGNAHAAGFNQLAKARILTSIAGFKKALAGVTAADIKLMGKVSPYIKIAYGVDFANDDLISLGFYGNSFAGGSHPDLDMFTLTYDLKAGRELKLADLFKPRSKYLTTIADFAMRDLKGRKAPQTGENMGIEDGLKPTLENYKHWNVTEKGLVITFLPNQVAGYGRGPQTVMIPYAYLKDIARPDGALSKIKR